MFEQIKVLEFADDGALRATNGGISGAMLNIQMYIEANDFSRHILAEYFKENGDNVYKLHFPSLNTSI